MSFLDSLSQSKTLIPHPFSLELVTPVQTSRIDGTDEFPYRTYQTPEGNVYPSVTTVLGYLKDESFEDVLKEWKDKVGHKEADHIVAHACTSGTWMHEQIENYFLSDPIIYNSVWWKLLKNIHSLLKHISVVYGLEIMLYSDTLGIAGASDCVGLYKGRVAIIDFKNSRSQRKDEFNKEYYIQAMIYAIMFYELYGVEIQDVVILVSINNDYPTDTKRQEFVVPLPVIIDMYYDEFIEKWTTCDLPNRVQQHFKSIKLKG